MIFGILVVIFVIVCIFLCLLILIQSDKGGGISGSIGGGLGGASSLLGTQDTANILTRGTTIFSGVFMVLCILMSVFFNRENETGQKSILQERAEKQQSFSPSSVLSGQSLPLQGAQEVSPAPATGTLEGAPAGEQNTLPVVPPAESK